MPRNWTVTTTRGHCIRFEKDVPTFVPDDMKVIEECKKYGASYVNADEQPELPDQHPIVTGLPKSAEEKEARIRALFEEMKAHQSEHRHHFTGQGRPQVKYVNETMGFDVNAAEIERLWNKVVFPETDT